MVNKNELLNELKGLRDELFADDERDRIEFLNEIITFITEQLVDKSQMLCLINKLEDETQSRYRNSITSKRYSQDMETIRSSLTSVTTDEKGYPISLMLWKDDFPFDASWNSILDTLKIDAPADEIELGVLVRTARCRTKSVDENEDAGENNPIEEHDGYYVLNFKVDHRCRIYKNTISELKNQFGLQDVTDTDIAELFREYFIETVANPDWKNDVRVEDEELFFTDIHCDDLRCILEPLISDSDE